ncbi:MAG: HAMP domain-containing histidine kinase [Bacillus sp. (in: Bacteria)]|nr:HAMP domain-containing histidine kinase [Bacillus sp. (in: firmicutes)]MCM1426647.1 HAMP domain-containing histidine kinase [Eubacterium sp.]
MKQTIFSRSIFHAAVITAASIIITLCGLSMITRYDNKYITKSALTQDNLALIPENGYCALVDGWELYPDALLAPEDFSMKELSCYRIQAGEYPNLALFHDDRNPYGCATWRLHLQGNGTFTLYLPEPLCAVKVFVDGQCLGGSGTVSSENYAPLIKDTAYSFILNGSTELIIQTANYSHYYGGIWYAPIIGDPDSVSRLISLRILLYGTLFFPSITLAFFCITLWRRKENGSYPAIFYFGLLSLSFALQICYPFFRLSGITFVRTFYAVEDAAALSGIFFSLKIACLLFLPKNAARLKRILCALSLGFCCIGVIVPLFVIPAFPDVTAGYGVLLSWYKLIMAGLLISITVYGCFMGMVHNISLLAAATANGLCLLGSVLTIGHYEPFIGAYPEEYGMFCMVVAYALLMMQQNRATVEENIKLNLHLQEEVQEKTEHLQKLLIEREQLIAELGHDMKSPLTSLSNMAQIIRLNDIMLDEDTRSRMQHIEKQCGILSERLKSIQEIATQTSSPSQMEPLMLNDFLADFYHSSYPIIELYGPNFVKKITPHPCRVMANREQLFRTLENLLYNAADFTPPEGKITLSLSAEKSYACIKLTDTGCGISEKDLPNIFKRSYTTRSDNGGQGLGLAIARAIILEHGGKIDVVSKEGEGTTFCILLPLLT